MIDACGVTKKFDGKTAIDNLNCSIPNGSIFGIVGCNGAGKSTLMRLLSGVYRPESGIIAMHGEPVYDNAAVKKRLVFIADELYLPNQSTMESMANMYCCCYGRFNRRRYFSLESSEEDSGNNTSLTSAQEPAPTPTPMPIALPTLNNELQQEAGEDSMTATERSAANKKVLDIIDANINKRVDAAKPLFQVRFIADINYLEETYIYMNVDGSQMEELMGLMTVLY